MQAHGIALASAPAQTQCFVPTNDGLHRHCEALQSHCAWKAEAISRTVRHFRYRGLLHPPAHRAGLRVRNDVVVEDRFASLLMMNH